MPELNVTMVAFHGTEKPSDLQTALDEVFQEIDHNLQPDQLHAFTPYSHRQIHATLVGMEVDVVNGRLVNRWFNRNRAGQERQIDTKRLREIVASFIHNNCLFTVRLGGFPEAYCQCQSWPQAQEGWECVSSPAEFHSCDRTTYEGSYYAFSPGPAMLTGWPISEFQHAQVFPHSLYEFRKAAEEAGFLDKYHSDDKPHWRDDDFFIRIGTFASGLSPNQLGSIEDSVRRRLAGNRPVTIDVNVGDVSIVLYESPSLDEEYVRARVPLAEFLKDHTSVDELYGQVVQRCSL